MKKEYILGILFFSALWGLSEALLGGALYAAEVRFASIPLTLVAFSILAISRSYLPQKGTATLIGLCAMLFKFLNSPLFLCHFLGIAILGICFDIFFAIFDIKKKAIAGFAAAFVNYAAFAVMMTFIIRYKFWTGSLDKFYGHIVGGVIAAVGCAIVTPFMLRVGQAIKAKLQRPFSLKLKPAEGTVSFATAGLWIFSLCVFSIHMINTGR